MFFNTLLNIILQIIPLGGGLMGGGAFGGGAMQEPVQWHDSVSYNTDGTVSLIITATVDEGWHIYSQNHKGTALPLEIKVQEGGCFRMLGDKFSEAPDAEEHYDEVFKETELYHSGVVTYAMPVKVRCDSLFTITAHAEGQACIDGSCVPVESDFSFEIDPAMVVPFGSSIDADAEADTSLLWFFLIAFGGGLLGILTPCVFPMIPMTVSYFMKHGGRRQAIFYGVSIVAIYLILGVALSAIFGQGFANDISTHWLPNVLFTVIFIVFAISLLGYFEISLPSSWVNSSARNEERAGYVGTFFMALTLVLVSFSCTLPIAGAVALGAADGSFLKPIVGMLGFSLAFALPFTLFAFFPEWLGRLPKSGSWMGALKVTLAVVELAFAFKFLSVADQAYGWNILPRQLFLAIWIILFALLGLYFLGVIKFPVDGGAKPKLGWGRGTMAAVNFAIVAYLLPGMWGAPLNAISGWLPPMSTQTFVLGGDNKAMAENLAWQNSAVMDYDTALDSSKTAGKPVLLMFTGHGCVNCRKMEQKVLADSAVAMQMKNYIICTLYVDDKVSKLSEPFVTAEGESLSMLGDKNKYIQKALFHQNAQPCHYIIDGASGKVLRGPVFYTTEVVEYLEFLVFTRHPEL